MKRALLVLVLATCSLAGTARADGDPASDYLLGQKVFFPFDVKIPAAKQRELTALVNAANHAGYHIRVALIASSYDLGSITSLWRKPRTYARFLGAELQFVYKDRLLIVMPNGFGISRQGQPVDREYRTLETIPVRAGATGLVDAAEVAVRKLSKQAAVAVPATSDASHGHQSKALIVLAAVAAVAVLVLLRLALRRR